VRGLWVAVLLLLVLIADGFIFATNPLHVPGSNLPARLLGLQSFRELDPSMEPTFPEKTSLLVSAWPYWHADPRPGDIVAVIYPPDHSQADIKRVIALAGSTVEIRNSIVFVDGKAISEPYLHAVIPNWNVPRSMARITVPAGKLLVMGDNRDKSEDSRRWGAIARESIIGKFWF
jgi:signal peptidase I